jgi:enoyl-CoA hydratase/carnithine racemase
MHASELKPQHFALAVADRVATITLNRPERKNPLTFDSYAELRDTLRALKQVDDVKAVVITGAGGNFCSGGDVHEIIGPLVKMNEAELNTFTRMTGDLILAMRGCPQPIIAAIDGVCAGAGACVAMAADLRFGTAQSRVAFLFVRVGLAGCDMGACAMLPRIVGHGRAAELLFTGRALDGAEAERWGFYNRLVEPTMLLAEAQEAARRLAHGPTLAHATTKRMLNEEWDMGLEEAVLHEAREQAKLMQKQDFARAYHAFVAKQQPVFEGN